MPFNVNLDRYQKVLDSAHLVREVGKVSQVTGFLVKGILPGACVGSTVEIFPFNGRQSFLAEVIGFEREDVLMMPLENMEGVGLGSKIILQNAQATVKVGDDLLGRVINGLSEPLDGKGDLLVFHERPLYADSTNPLLRPKIRKPMHVGVRAIDGLLTFGRGQRIGIMAGSGVGKSVLLGMMARNSESDINVIALVGERGREVREFIEENLGPEGLKKSVVVVAASDQSPLLRMRGAYVAATIAEYFCDQGKNVLFMMDSVTRFAMAKREIGLSVGEPPATKGYTPSVFSSLPKLLERAGMFENKGSITGLYTVLVEGDDMDDPIGDAVRSIVDGHIVLDRSLAHRSHFPAIDILQSTSRVMPSVVSAEHMRRAAKIKELEAVYRNAEDLVNIGAYKKGSNPEIDEAVRLHGPISSFLKQNMREVTSGEETEILLSSLVG